MIDEMLSTDVSSLQYYANIMMMSHDESAKNLNPGTVTQ